MPTERIVNRVLPTKEYLEHMENIELGPSAMGAVYIPESAAYANTPTTSVIPAGACQNSKVELAADAISQVLDEANRVSLDAFLVFRAEVMAAFKHLGLDVPKHFRS